MNILLTGATGFIGRNLAQALLATGHSVTGAVRNPDSAPQHVPGIGAVHVDYHHALTPAAWMPRLLGIDVVINAVGILRESPGQSFDVIHHRAPRALFEACAAAGVKRVIQISALGATAEAQTEYFRSKKAADDALARLAVDYVIVQPSIVYGPGGGSAALFARMAKLPLIPVPGSGEQPIQPVYIDDLVELIVELVEISLVPSRRIAVVGPNPLTLKTFYAQLRLALGKRSKARFISIPMPLMEFTANLGRHVPGAPLDPDTLHMLTHGSTADPGPMYPLLKRLPRPVTRFHAEGRAPHAE